jgi:hypothetical protein
MFDLLYWFLSCIPKSITIPYPSIDYESISITDINLPSYYISLFISISIHPKPNYPINPSRIYYSSELIIPIYYVYYISLKIYSPLSSRYILCATFEPIYIFGILFLRLPDYPRPILLKPGIYAAWPGLVTTWTFTTTDPYLENRC